MDVVLYQCLGEARGMAALDECICELSLQAAHVPADAVACAYVTSTSPAYGTCRLQS